MHVLSYLYRPVYFSVHDDLTCLNGIQHRNGTASDLLMNLLTIRLEDLGVLDISAWL